MPAVCNSKFRRLSYVTTLAVFTGRVTSRLCRPKVLAVAVIPFIGFAFRWPFFQHPLPKTSNSGTGFKIGMFSFEYMPVQPYTWCPPTVTVTSGGDKSSQLDVLAEDGFNIVQSYNHNWSDQNMDSVLQLVAANGLQMFVEAKQYYVPNIMMVAWPWSGVPHAVPLGTGTNDYIGGNVWGSCDWKVRPNYQTLIDNIYSKPANKDTVWGHEITEEASFFHCFNYTNVASNYCDSQTTVSVEVPPSNVFQVIKYFRNRLNSQGAGQQKLIVMEANHAKSIHDGTDDGQGQYNPQDYLHGPADGRPDVFFEGSYSRFPQNNWSSEDYSSIKQNGPNDNWHYLGAFKSMDYGFLQVPEVHKVINVEAQYVNVIHGDESIQNANWLWFQAYASIIHRAAGVWFWDLDSSWKPGEKPGNWNQLADRYESQHFSAMYRYFIAPLAREIRYLVNNNFLNTDAASVLQTKTDHPDDLCIVPDPASYVPFDASHPHGTEEYGIRYTLRTNGQDVIMIAVNPLAVQITPTFTFQNIANATVANATGVEVLFETNQDNPANSSYKTTRSGRVDLSLNSAQTRAIPYAVGTRGFSDVFGPLDTHVYKFVKGSSTAPKPLWNHRALNWDAHARADGDLIVASNSKDVFYRGTDKRIYHFWDDHNRWHEDALNYNAPARAASNLVLSPSGGQLFYIGTDQRVYDYWWDAPNDKWQMDALDYNAPPRAASNLVLDPSGDRVFYIGTDKRVYNYWWDAPNDKWHMDALNYNAPARAASNLVRSPSEEKLFYIGTDKRVYSYRWDAANGKWQMDALDYNAPARAASNLVLDPSGDKVFYIGTDKRVYSYWWDAPNDKWHMDALNYTAPARAASNLVRSPSEEKLFYIGTDKRVYSYRWDAANGKWLMDALDYAAPANAMDHLVVSPSGGQVFFVGTDNRIYNFWWNPNANKWQLDWLTGCAPALGIHDLVMDRFGHLYCIAADNRVYTFYWSPG